MMVIRIVACKSSTPLSWFIRKFCKSPYSHLGIMANNGKMVDADWGGVRVRSLPKEYDEFYVSVPEAGWKNACSWLAKQTGKDYDHFALPGLAIYTAMGWRRKPNLLQAEDKFFCSELVFRFCEEAGVTLMGGIDSANYHPGRILDSSCRKQYNIKKKKGFL